MKRTSVYIDGFNLYHAIDELKKPHLKWLNLWSLSESLLRDDEQLTTVNYYTAYATWLPGPYARHRTYVAALQSVGVNVVMGQFKDKHIKCRSCKAMFTTKEEKRTDVNIALGLVVDGLQDMYDRAILISADTDLVAAVNEAKRLQPEKEVFIAVPPGRYARAGGFGRRYEFKPGRLAKNLLDAEYRSTNGDVIASRPGIYNPPG